MSAPLGRNEGQKLEFKRAEVLRRPHVVARGVVALLNAGGGTLWIGIVEEGGRAVAIDPVPDPRGNATRLRNHLLDTIDPPLSEGPEGDFELEVVETEDQALLRLRVGPGRNKPYAQLKDGGRFFHLRVGDRIRAMTREEIRGEFHMPPPANPLERAEEELLRARAQASKEARGTLWIRLQPAIAMDLELRSNRLRQLLTIPGESGNRDSGWTVVNLHLSPTVGSGFVGIGDEYYGQTRIWRDGTIDYRAPIERLWHDNPGGPPTQIYPYALLELPVSLLRLSARVHGGSSDVEGTSSHRSTDEDPFMVDMGLFHAKGWKLRAYSPKSYGYILRHGEKVIDTDALTLDRPLRFTRRELLENPDRCALRLIRLVYELIGFEEDCIPSEFDRQTGSFKIGG